MFKKYHELTYIMYMAKMELCSNFAESEVMDMYIKRHAEKVIEKATKQTKTVLVSGARQVGKSTLIQNRFSNYEYITLDDDNELMLANNDPLLFFKDRDEKIVIDEVQYAKVLFKTIKLIVDKNSKKGQMILTGSQSYELLSLASKHLVGRVSIIELPSLSLREKYKLNFLKPFIPNIIYLKQRKEELVEYKNIWDDIHRGSMPELLDSKRNWNWFYRDYIKTYLERDVRDTISLKDELKFRQFLVSLAARTGQVVVYQDIANDIGVDIKTVQSWLSIVVASGIVKLIHTYKNNIIKRAVKSPKLFFMDTGLVCYLTGWGTPAQTKNGAMAGNIFETFVVSEIIKSYLNQGLDIEDWLFYYRDRDGKEIDLIINDNNDIYPIEIKMASTIKTDMIKNFSVLNDVKDINLKQGFVICQIDKETNITEDIKAIPINMI